MSEMVTCETQRGFRGVLYKRRWGGLPGGSGRSPLAADEFSR